MTDGIPSIPRPSQLWKQLTADRKAQAADAFWRDDNAAIEQAEVTAVIAQRLKFRAKSVIAMPIDRKVRQIVGIPGVSELVAARLLVSYHLVQQRPMMGAFLDALGIAHEEGLIADESMEPPSAEALTGAAATLAKAYPVEDVRLYLSTLVWQDPATWGGLSETPKVAATTV